VRFEALSLEPHPSTSEFRRRASADRRFAPDSNLRFRRNVPPASTERLALSPPPAALALQPPRRTRLHVRLSLGQRLVHAVGKLFIEKFGTNVDGKLDAPEFGDMLTKVLDGLQGATAV
jgi:hypothetical protein